MADLTCYSSDLVYNLVCCSRILLSFSFEDYHRYGTCFSLSPLAFPVEHCHLKRLLLPAWSLGAFGLSALFLAHGSVVTGSMLAGIQFVSGPLVITFSREMCTLNPYRPNVYVDAYDDPKSRHWLVPDTLLSHRWVFGTATAADEAWT